MIRLIYVLRRKPELSLEEFQEYWRETHGPLVASHAGHLDILRYVQVPTLDDPVNEQLPGARGTMEPPYDGVAELWWETPEALATAFATAEGQAAGAELLEDERRFIDLGASPMWLAHDYPQINPTPEDLVAGEYNSVVKLYYPLRHLQSLSLVAAQEYWRTAHGPLIRSIAPAARIRRYIQVHRYESEIEATLRESRGTRVEAYTGHAELWFDRADLRAPPTPERARGGELAIADESKFIDFSRSAMWIAKERVFIDRR